MEIQSTSEMTPYFTMTKCNKLFITYLTRSTERLPSLPSSISTISTISMTVVVTMLLKKRQLRQYAKMYSERGRYVINIYLRKSVSNTHARVSASRMQFKS